MSLPNYTPDGIIYLGCVPWDNSYSDVRLYETIGEQQGDILPRLDMTSEDYVYIGRDRRLKLSIPADRLYHANYCAYRNRSITQGWIYCFITDVSYINDNTSEITIETDVFQTYLYATDWDVPACMVERETVREEEKYLLTAEDDFPLAYVTDYVSHYWFQPSAFTPEGTVTFTSGEISHDDSIAQAILNPTGKYLVQPSIKRFRGLPQGCGMLFHTHPSSLHTYLSSVNETGGSDAVEAIIVPAGFVLENASGSQITSDGWIAGNEEQESPNVPDETFNAPVNVLTCDGYEPKNRKVLYYPYTYIKLTDYNGSQSDIRYEFFESGREFGIKAPLNPQCQAIVYPRNYRGGIEDFESGITVKCGALGSWSNSGYQAMVGQNLASVGVDVALTAATFIPGAGAVAGAARAGKMASRVASAVGNSAAVREVAASSVERAAGRLKKSAALTGTAAGKVGADAVTIAKNRHQPIINKGQVAPDIAFQAGIQGVHAERVTLKAEYAEQIDKYFSTFGYAIERTKKPELFTRKSWNYVKTIGAVAKSKSEAPSANAVHTRGAGTPASALALIASMFDAGITFWHTTDGFGDYSLDNSIVG